MLKFKINPRTIVSILFVSVLGAAIYGCQSGSSAPATQSTAAAAPPAFALLGPPPIKSGVEIWSENCMRCHNGRPPQEFSASQWDTIVHHMRLRANLTGEESREVVKFLQASN